MTTALSAILVRMTVPSCNKGNHQDTNKKKTNLNGFNILGAVEPKQSLYEKIGSDYNVKEFLLMLLLDGIELHCHDTAIELGQLPPQMNYLLCCGHALWHKLSGKIIT